jgi:hypothetical protein
MLPRLHPIEVVTHIFEYDSGHILDELDFRQLLGVVGQDDVWVFDGYLDGEIRLDEGEVELELVVEAAAEDRDLVFVEGADFEEGIAREEEDGGVEEEHGDSGCFCVVLELELEAGVVAVDVDARFVEVEV